MTTPTEKCTNVIACCWDIEAIERDIIGIGAAVMDMDKSQVLESKLIKGYYPSRPMKERVWKEFWCHHQDILELLKVEVEEGPTFEENQARMVRELLDFVINAERIANRLNKRFHIVSDNKLFDLGFMNQKIAKYYDETFQLPYSPLAFSQGEFIYLARVYETQSMQFGLLSQYDPEYAETNQWGFGERIRKLWAVPDYPVEHDHNPVNDAISQLYDYQSLLRIYNGSYKFVGV